MRFLIIFIFLISNSLADETIHLKNLIINDKLKKYDAITFLDTKNNELNLDEYKGNLVSVKTGSTAFTDVEGTNAAVKTMSGGHISSSTLYITSGSVTSHTGHKLYQTAVTASKRINDLFQENGEFDFSQILKIKQFPHEEFFKQRLKDKKFYLTDLAKLDCFDEDIKNVIDNALLQTGQTVSYDDHDLHQDIIYDNTLTLLKATQMDDVFSYDVDNNSYTDPIPTSSMITSDQCKRIINTLKKNVHCYDNQMDVSKECISCEVCRYNVECVNNPINFSINEYIYEMNFIKNQLKEDVKKYNNAQLILAPEFNGIKFYQQSPAFLDGLHIAKKRGSNEALVSFGGASYGDDAISRGGAATSQIYATVDRLKRVVFQEKLQQIEQTFHNGTEQTPLNFMLHTNNIDITLLPYEYNMNDMHRKGVLDEDLTMTKTGWIYQYNAIPNNKDYEAATYWMQKTYEHLYGKLND